MREMVDQLSLNVSHFFGSGWNKNNFDYSRFTCGKKIKSKNAINALIALRGHRCEQCGNEIWLGNPIPLEVHHIDGEELNSELSNLQLLCPNCHALTSNYRGKNINQKRNQVSDQEFVDALMQSNSIRQALIKIGLTPKGGNYLKANELIQRYQIDNFLV